MIACCTKKIKELFSQIRRNRKRIDAFEKKRVASTAKTRVLQKQVKRIESLREFKKKHK